MHDNPTPREKRETAARNLERVRQERAHREHDERHRLEQLAAEQAAPLSDAEYADADRCGRLSDRLRGDARRPPVRVPDPGRGLTTEQGAELERQERLARLVRGGEDR